MKTAKHTLTVTHYHQTKCVSILTFLFLSMMSMLRFPFPRLSSMLIVYSIMYMRWATVRGNSLPTRLPQFSSNRSNLGVYLHQRFMSVTSNLYVSYTWNIDGIL